MGEEDQSQSPLNSALADLTEALNAGTKVQEAQIISFLVAAREVRGLVLERNKVVSRVIMAISTLVEEGPEEAEGGAESRLGQRRAARSGQGVTRDA